MISPDKVQAPALIRKALKMYEAEIERAGIEATLCIEPTYEALNVDWVILDPSRLLQIMINLLTNSIKFTQYSDVRKIRFCVGASYQRPTGQHHGISFVPPRYNRPCRTPSQEWGHGEDIYIQIAVYDTGKGLDTDEMKVLFGRFQQASPKTYKQYGGSGLGLFISRELCELQGGQIGVASVEGQTVFTFYVKAKRWVDEEVLVKDASQGVEVSAAVSPMVFTRRGSAVLPAEGVDGQMVEQLLSDGTLLENFRPASRRSSTRSTTPSSGELETLHEEVKGVAEEGTKVLQERKHALEINQLHVLIVEDNTISEFIIPPWLALLISSFRSKSHVPTAPACRLRSSSREPRPGMSRIFGTIDLLWESHTSFNCFTGSGDAHDGWVDVYTTYQRTTAVWKHYIACAGHCGYCECEIRADPLRY